MLATFARIVGAVTLGAALSAQAPMYDTNKNEPNIYDANVVPVFINTLGAAQIGCFGSPTTDRIAFAKRLAEFKRYNPHILVTVVAENDAPSAAVVKYRTLIFLSRVEITNRGTLCP
jgi:hypothetical protein